MKKALIVLLISTAFSCTSSLDDAKYQPNNPCNDTQYLILKNKNDTSLTADQRKFVKTKEAECEKFVKKHEERMSDKAQANRNLIYILVGLGALFALGFFLAITLGAYKM